MEEVVQPEQRGRKRTCSCGACKKCRRREYARARYNAPNLKAARQRASAAERTRRWREEHPKEYALQMHRWQEHNLVRRMLERAATRAKEGGLEFSITAADIVVPEYCPVLGLRLVLPTGLHTRCGGFSRHDSPSLDRIISPRGYVPGNVWVISLRANILKKDATPEELRRLADAVEARVRAIVPRFEISPFV